MGAITLRIHLNGVSLSIAKHKTWVDIEIKML